uniref:Gag-Pol polyprotein n=1 Tax=Tanacetum cinerariifolium TaxID=118510 RepID=A0A6L2NLY7_TANCI|nr:Gag-Pol polyprotein [Tanacetum cinerariifolium]
MIQPLGLALLSFKEDLRVWDRSSSATKKDPITYLNVEIPEFKVSKSATFKAKASKSTASKFKEVHTLKNPPQTFTIKSHVAIRNYIIDLANVDTWDSIVKKTYGVRKPTDESANTFKNFLGEQLERFYFGPPWSNLALDTTCHGVIVSTPRERPQLPTSVVPYRVSTRDTYYTLIVGNHIMHPHCEALKTVPKVWHSSMSRDGSVFVYNPNVFREQFASLVIRQGLPFNHLDNPQRRGCFKTICSQNKIMRMIATPGEPDLPVPVLESFHEQTDEEQTENDIKWMDADDQAIQTILLGLPELRQTKNLHEVDFTQIYDFLKMNQDKNGGNQNHQGYNAWQNGEIQVAHNAVQNGGVQSGGNQNGLVVVPEIANQNGTGNVVDARAKGTGNGNQAMCYNCRGLGHIARNCTARPRRRDAAYLLTQLLIAQKEEAGIQLQAEEFDFMAGVDGSAEVQLNDNCYDNEIFNMFTQEEQYTDILEPIPKPQLVPQNDNHVTFVAPSMVQSGGTIEISSAPNKETVYRNLVDQVAQVNMVNCNMRATNA